LVERDAALDDAGVRVTSREGELALRLAPRMALNKSCRQ
jgi:hypothetical protein